jgi:anti-sigma regulatory factor (Ser/Thr protein kinase)
VSRGLGLEVTMSGRAGPEAPGLWHAALFYRGADEFEEGACGLATTGANPGRLISTISRFAQQHSGRPIWCVQEAAWPSRPQEELWEVIRHEALTNLALESPVRMLCPYDASLPAELISCAEATHPVIVRHGRWQASPRYHPADHDEAVPRTCERPLPPPPASARTLRYRDDLTGLRSLVSAQTQAAGLPSRRTSDLMMAVSELAANTLVHTRGPGTLTLWTTDTELVCQVRDSGHITDPLAGRLRPSPKAIGAGRGLWLVHQLCDLVQIRTGPAGTTIRVHMRTAP